jgi:ATP-dependent DNA helicase RecG
MTATPIPRTLALTLYGELEVSRLDEMPPGRQPIRSESVSFAKRQQVYEEIRQEVRQGRQAYIVCPLIDENEALEATAAIEEARILGTKVFPEFSVGLLHGRMKASEKEEVMETFRKGEHHILISTTVIEVGVDVPNATIMLVQDADRFGLAQLHQLRGRVGRGSHASRCLFMGNATSSQTQRRLAAIARLSDGFEVAEEDLQIRGPGDYYGVRQAGFPELKVADLLRDIDLVELARSAARELLAQDPELARPEHRVLRQHFENLEAKVAETVH